MKNQHCCPKCGGVDILMVPGNLGAYGTGNNIRLGLWSTNVVLVNRYVCCDCGFSEEWIDKEDIEKLKAKY